MIAHVSNIPFHNLIMEVNNGHNYKFLRFYIAPSFVQLYKFSLIFHLFVSFNYKNKQIKNVYRTEKVILWSSF